MAGVELLPTRVLGSAWPQHMNRAVAMAAHANIQKVGMPQWSEADQALARALQKELGGREQGLSSGRRRSCSGPVRDNRGGGSDDIGDITWNVPTITLRYPANIPGLPGHNWSSAIAMATPIAHKGTTAGAKVQAMTMIDLLTKPELVKMAWDYFRDVQTKEIKYEPLLRAAGQAGDPHEPGAHGEVPRADAEVLLRSDELQDVPRAARDQVSDCEEIESLIPWTRVR